MRADATGRPRGGMLVGMAERYYNLFGQVIFDEIAAGRACALSLYMGNALVIFVNLHAEELEDRSAAPLLLEAVRDWLRVRPRHFLVMVGDFNFVAEDDSRYFPETGASSVGDDPLASAWARVFPHLLEVGPHDYTHATRRDGAVDCVARLGRAYLNLTAVSALDLGVTAGVMGTIMGANPSDHLPVALRFFPVLLVRRSAPQL